MARRLISLLFVATMVALMVDSAAWAASPETLLARGSFPLTGFQLMIAGIVAVVLVGGGILLRRMSRSQKH
jgi:hypothetical protein